MGRLLFASAALYIANQTTLAAIDEIPNLGLGCGTFGRAFIGANTVLCCQTIILTGWALERAGRRVKTHKTEQNHWDRTHGSSRATTPTAATGMAERSWRGRWARVERGLWWAVVCIALGTVVGIVLLALGWALGQ